MESRDGSTVPPGLRLDYEGFLRQCATKYPNMALVWQNDILVQTPEDYEDDVHAKRETARRFSKAFADWQLRTRCAKNRLSQIP